MNSSHKLKNIAAMTIFGTIGIFVKYIPLPSSFIAMVRGFVGFAVLLLASFVLKRSKQKEDIPFKLNVKNALLLFVSGGFIGVNWILLFEAYNYTTVATATLCYYLAPVFVIILSAPLLHEKLTVKKVLCVIAALVGMAFVSGIPSGGLPELSELTGIFLGIGAAALYAAVVLFNMKLGGIPATTKTMLQLVSAAIVVMPYVFMTEDVLNLDYNLKTIVLLLVVGVLHTGIAYSLYFDSLGGLKAQTVSILGYIDPVVAIILSVVLLGEPMTLFNAIGALLILGSTLISELDLPCPFGAKKGGDNK